MRASERGDSMFSSNRSRYRHVTRFERNGKASEYFSTVVLFTAQYQDEWGKGIVMNDELYRAIELVFEGTSFQLGSLIVL